MHYTDVPYASLTRRGFSPLSPLFFHHYSHLVATLIGRKILPKPLSHTVYSAARCTAETLYRVGVGWVPRDREAAGNCWYRKLETTAGEICAV